jgi:hypothetical protein
MVSVILLICQFVMKLLVKMTSIMVTSTVAMHSHCFSENLHNYFCLHCSTYDVLST